MSSWSCLVSPIETEPSRGPRIVSVRTGTLDLVRRAGGDRVAVYDLENEASTPIYVHAKVMVIDDEVALIGSDNMNRPSWTHDSELSIAVSIEYGRSSAARSMTTEKVAHVRRDLRLTLTRSIWGFKR